MPGPEQPKTTHLFHKCGEALVCLLTADIMLSIACNSWPQDLESQQQKLPRLVSCPGSSQAFRCHLLLSLHANIACFYRALTLCTLASLSQRSTIIQHCPGDHVQVAQGLRQGVGGSCLEPWQRVQKCQCPCLCRTGPADASLERLVTTSRPGKVQIKLANDLLTMFDAGKSRLVLEQKLPVPASGLGPSSCCNLGLAAWHLKASSQSLLQN